MCRSICPSPDFTVVLETGHRWAAAAAGEGKRTWAYRGQKVVRPARRHRLIWFMHIYRDIFLSFGSYAGERRGLFSGFVWEEERIRSQNSTTSATVLN
jgi:hypothetical protein